MYQILKTYQTLCHIMYVHNSNPKYELKQFHKVLPCPTGGSTGNLRKHLKINHAVPDEDIAGWM